MYFIIYMAANIVWALIAMRFLRVPNPVMVQCPSCGAKLHARPATYRWHVADYAGWALLVWITVWRHEQIPLAIKMCLMLVVVFAWARIITYAVHQYFMWRHPWRCQGGGHVKPTPQAV